METPYLDWIFRNQGPGLRVTVRRPLVEPGVKPVTGIDSSARCGACSGTGRPRRTRERSAAVGATTRRRGTCKRCEGRGYEPLDARPMSAGNSGSFPIISVEECSNNRLQAPRRTMLENYVEAEIADDLFMRARARRLLSVGALDVAESWCSDRGVASRPGLHSVWPLTRYGRRAYDNRHSNVTGFVKFLCDKADLESTERLQAAESEAERACLTVYSAQQPTICSYH